MGLANVFLNNKILHTDLVHGKKTPCLQNKYNIAELSNLLETGCFSVPSVELNGIFYKTNSIITLSSQSMEFTFGHIVDIIISQNSQVFLISKKK